MGTDRFPLLVFDDFALGKQPSLVSEPRGLRDKLKGTHSSKCLPRFGSARRFAIVFRTLLSGRMTITGTGEWLRQYLRGKRSR